MAYAYEIKEFSNHLKMGLENTKNTPLEIEAFTHYLIKALKFDYEDKKLFIESNRVITPERLILSIDYCLYDMLFNKTHIPGEAMLPKELQNKFHEISDNIEFLFKIIENSKLDKEFIVNFRVCCIAVYGTDN